MPWTKHCFSFSTKRCPKVPCIAVPLLANSVLPMKILIAIISLSLAYLTVAQVTCNPGSYDAGAAGCKKCPLGTYQPDEGRAGCKPCPDGYVSKVEGSVECVACGPNEEPTQFKDTCKCRLGAVTDRRGNCILCKSGQYMFRRPNGKRLCALCGSKQFQPEAGQTRCLACPRGQFGNKDRAACVECAEGEVLLDGVCGKCPPGQTLIGDSCTDCRTGTFKATKGQEPCLDCPRKSFSRFGSAKCITCPEGQALMRNGKCAYCPPGSHYDFFDMGCDVGFQGAFSPDENVRNSCFFCADDSYSMQGASKCTKCRPNERLMRDGTCGTCPPGTFLDFYNCRKCFQGQYQPYENVLFDCLDCAGETNSRKGATTCSI